MAYSSRRGRRPAEYASKIAHSHIINDEKVKEFLENCNLPKSVDEIGSLQDRLENFSPLEDNPIENIIAVDGGYTEISVKNEFPSSTIAFFQFGALFFEIEDLETLDISPFIDPEDMAKLKKINRLKLTIPVRNITLKGDTTLTHSVRKAIYLFFLEKIEEEKLIDSLKWFIFKEYERSPDSSWSLASCPYCGGSKIPLDRERMSEKYSWHCIYQECGEEIFLTDVFRLHEAIDDELGAGGILGYVTNAMEQIILVHLIRLILKEKPALLEKTLFIKDGPLAFFGQTANMYKPTRALVKFLHSKYNLFMVGLEKSGSFVEHADEIQSKLSKSQILILDDDYIYNYILPGTSDPSRAYGSTSYFSNKVIFKTSHGEIYVTSIPTHSSLKTPSRNDLYNIDAILTNVEKLKCDMYDNALIPIALVNKLVSLSDHPSSSLLQKFAKSGVNRS